MNEVTDAAGTKLRPRRLLAALPGAEVPTLDLTDNRGLNGRLPADHVDELVARISSRVAPIVWILSARPAAGIGHTIAACGHAKPPPPCPSAVHMMADEHRPGAQVSGKATR
jgi:hypothetical protein